MYTLAPFLRYCSATLASPSLKITTRCHSVFSLRSPVALSRQLSDVATLRFTTGLPFCMRRTSGSLPRLPTRMTLLTEPAITNSPSPLVRNHPTPSRSVLRGASGSCPRPNMGGPRAFYIVLFLFYHLAGQRARALVADSGF